MPALYNRAPDMRWGWVGTCPLCPPPFFSVPDLAAPLSGTEAGGGNMTWSVRPKVFIIQTLNWNPWLEKSLNATSWPLRQLLRFWPTSRGGGVHNKPSPFFRDSLITTSDNDMKLVSPLVTSILRHLTKFELYLSTLLGARDILMTSCHYLRS